MVTHTSKLDRADTLINYFFPALEVNFLKKLPQLVALQIFAKAYISIMGNHWTIIFYYIIIKLILNIFIKALYISQKTTKFGSQNFGYQIWFCTRLHSFVGFMLWITTTMNARLASYLFQCIIWAYGLQGISTLCQYLHALLVCLWYICILSMKQIVLQCFTLLMPSHSKCFMQTISFNDWVGWFVWNFKGTLEIPHKIILPHKSS